MRAQGVCDNLPGVDSSVPAEEHHFPAHCPASRQDVAVLSKADLSALITPGRTEGLHGGRGLCAEPRRERTEGRRGLSLSLSICPHLRFIPHSTGGLCLRCPPSCPQSLQSASPGLLQSAAAGARGLLGRLGCPLAEAVRGGPAFLDTEVCTARRSGAKWISACVAVIKILLCGNRRVLLRAGV